MSVTDISQMNSLASASEHRVPTKSARKSAPSFSSLRYPEPDPGDPFAPLALLRSRGLNSSRLSIQGDYPDITHAHLKSPLSSQCLVGFDSFPPINIAKKKSFAGVRPCSQDVGHMLEQNFPRMEQKSHYRRRTHSIAVTSESSPYTLHNLQTYILPIAQSPEEDKSYEIPTSSMVDNSSTTAISCGFEESGDNDSCDWTPRNLSAGRASMPSFTKYCGILTPPQTRRSTMSAARPVSFAARPMPALNDFPGSDSSSQHDNSSNDSMIVVTPLASASAHELTLPKHELFTFPRSSRLSLAQYAPFPGSCTVSVDTTLPIHPSSSGQYVKNMPSYTFATDLLRQPSASAEFDEIGIPTKIQLSEAASLLVIAENGLRVPFGDLWMQQQTIVCFIRHFWCPLCQDYMFSISTNVDPILLGQADVNLIIISNGSYKMIKFYRQIFNCPFAIYADPTLKLYTAMGMTLRTRDGEQDSQCGSYVRHGHMSGIAMVIKNALRVGMPVWEKGGDISQLGGEFILGPGLQCTFAHRMRTKRGHLPITRVLLAAGLESITPVEQVCPVMPFDMALDGEMRATSARRSILNKPTRGRAAGNKSLWCIASHETESVNEGSDEEGHQGVLEYKVRGRRLSKKEQRTRMA